MTELRAIQGDITRTAADAIVNAANSSLMGGGGVDGAIHAAGGPEVLEECVQIVERHGRLPTGEAVITTAGDLPARHVVHTVGPIWGSVDDDEAVGLLASCYRNSLDLAAEASCKTVTFPNISTGVYHFPKSLAAETAIDATRGWTGDYPMAIDEVLFVCFDAENFGFYDQLLGSTS